jgi:hypothetical protein
MNLTSALVVFVENVDEVLGVKQPTWLIKKTLEDFIIALLFVESRRIKNFAIS